MNFLLKIWEWFNGNKTIIGAVLISATTLPFIASHPDLVAALQWIGGILAGTGIAHKITKGLVK